MGASDYVGIGLFFLTLIFGAVGWLLKNKDEAQEAKITALGKKHDEDIAGRDIQIQLLFRKHDEDEKELRKLEVQIARNFYERPELDNKFEKLDKTFKDGFTLLGEKLDKMNSALLTHLGEHKT